MSKRLLLVIVLVVAAALAAGCAGTPGASALKKSQEREQKQLKAEGGTPAEKPAEKPATKPADSGKEAEKPAEEAAMLSAADATKAKGLFTSSCGGCHTLSAAGTSGTVGPKLDTTKKSADEINTQIVNGAGAMPGGLLTGDDAQLVADWVAQSVKG